MTGVRLVAWTSSLLCGQMDTDLQAWSKNKMRLLQVFGYVNCAILSDLDVPPRFKRWRMCIYDLDTIHEGLVGDNNVEFSLAIEVWKVIFRDVKASPLFLNTNVPEMKLSPHYHPTASNSFSWTDQCRPLTSRDMRKCFRICLTGAAFSPAFRDGHFALLLHGRVTDIKTCL